MIEMKRNSFLQPSYIWFLTKRLSFLILMVLIPFGKTNAQKNQDPEITIFIDHLFHLTEIMVADVASPPAAARFYAYSTLAAHLAWQYSGKEERNLNLLMKSNHSPSNTIDVPEGDLNQTFVSTYTLLEVGKRMMPSGNQLEAKQQSLISQFLKSKWIGKKNLKTNIEFSESVAALVLKISANDHYNKLSTLTRYSPKKTEGHWYPTPPAYMGAVEPEWRTLKTFFLEDLIPYKPSEPAPFSLEDGSPFQIQMDEVYTITSNLSDEQTLIANFWDCNPFNVNYSGHMAIGIKKISPGGHWVGITGISCKKADLPWKETLYIHALISMSLHDAFVSCWEEKYDSDRIRPESAINKYMDQRWRPLLQTPPFPEYTSGHSVISKTSAVLLTDFFGEDFDFIDSSEVYFGLPERGFDSFSQAADEAAISRLYGGIHFRDAITEGVKQGDKIGKFILERVN